MIRKSWPRRKWYLWLLFWCDCLIFKKLLVLTDRVVFHNWLCNLNTVNTKHNGYSFWRTYSIFLVLLFNFFFSIWLLCLRSQCFFFTEPYNLLILWPSECVSYFRRTYEWASVSNLHRQFHFSELNLKSDYNCDGTSS